MCSMANGIARERVRTTTTTTELCNMVPILHIIGGEVCSLGLPCTSLILDMHVMINWHLSKQGICWPVSRDHIAGSSLKLIEVKCFWRWPLTICWFSIGSRTRVRLTCRKQGRIVRKPVNASPGLKFIRIITFSSIQMFLTALFCVFIICGAKLLNADWLRKRAFVYVLAWARGKLRINFTSSIFKTKRREQFGKLWKYEWN